MTIQICHDQVLLGSATLLLNLLQGFLSFGLAIEHHTDQVLLVGSWGSLKKCSCKKHTFNKKITANFLGPNSFLIG